MDGEAEQVRLAIIQARETDGLTIAGLASRLGYSPSVVSQWIGGDKYTGDKRRLVRNAKDFLKNRERRKVSGLRPVESFGTRQVRAALNRLRKMEPPDIGIIYGAAGVGKTSGAILYAEENPLCIFVTLAQWARTASALEGLVFDQIDRGGWKGNTNRGEFICERLRGSARLLIVDNAHLATIGALQWLCDMHDQASIPVALVGNESVLRPMASLDQRFSRVGLKEEIRASDVQPLVTHLVRKVAPALVGLGEQSISVLAEGPGHFRLGVKAARLAQEIVEETGMEPVSAIKAACKRLVTATKFS